jgi:hypothetical protein
VLLVLEGEFDVVVGVGLVTVETDPSGCTTITVIVASVQAMFALLANFQYKGKVPSAATAPAQSRALPRPNEMFVHVSVDESVNFLKVRVMSVLSSCAFHILYPAFTSSELANVQNGTEVPTVLS